VTAYLIRRVIQMIIVLFVSTMVIYGLLNLAPGGPFDGMRALADKKSRISDAQIEQMQALLGLDKPPQIRYIAWLLGDDWMGVLDEDWEGTGRGILRGDFGNSFSKKQSVLEMMQGRIVKTVTLTGLSGILALLIAIPIGIFSAVRQYSKADYAVTFFAFVGVAIPSFWFGLMMIIVFGNLFNTWDLPYMPTKGWQSLRIQPGSVPAVLGAKPGSVLDIAVHLVMPVFVLSLLQMAGWTRFMRTSMLEVLQMDYVRTARAKGLSERVVIVKHTLRNALIPLVTIITFELPALFSGTILTETVFAIPGMGRLYIEALSGFDYPVTQAYLLIVAALTVVATLLSDILYTVVDPRIRFS